MHPDDEVRLKEAINQFLWMHLPGHTTLEEAEKIAVEMYDRIRSLTKEEA